MRKVDHDPKAFAFAYEIASEICQAFGRRSARSEDAAVGGGICPRVGQRNCAQAKLKENAQQIEIGSKWLGPLHREEKSDASVFPRATDFLIRLAYRDLSRSLRAGVKTRDLAQARR